MYLRKLFFCILLSLSLLSSVKSQTNADKRLLGGNFSMATSFSHEKNIQVNFDFINAKFKTHNFALGYHFGVNYLNYKGEYSYNGVDVSPGLLCRYYIGKSGFKPFLEATIEPSFFFTKNKNDSINTSNFGINLTSSAGLGCAYMLTENIAIEGILSYKHDWFNKFSDKLIFRVGFQIYFTK